MSETIKLKPCPFCGKPPSMMSDFGGYFAKCIACGTSQESSETQEEAIEAWNQRVGE